MNNARNDVHFDRLPVDQVCSGYEAAIRDYEIGQSSLKEAAKSLDLIGIELEYARLCMDEADVQLDAVVLEFNATDPVAPEFRVLMAELDLASDEMLRKSEVCEQVQAKYQIARECYESELASSSEKLSVATALRTELVVSMEELAGNDASNDAYYAPEQMFAALSDKAYRFLRQAA